MASSDMVATFVAVLCFVTVSVGVTASPFPAAAPSSGSLFQEACESAGVDAVLCVGPLTSGSVARSPVETSRLARALVLQAKQNASETAGHLPHSYDSEDLESKSLEHQRCYQGCKKRAEQSKLNMNELNYLCAETASEALSRSSAIRECVLDGDRKLRLAVASVAASLRRPEVALEASTQVVGDQGVLPRQRAEIVAGEGVWQAGASVAESLRRLEIASEASCRSSATRERVLDGARKLRLARACGEGLWQGGSCVTASVRQPCFSGRPARMEAGYEAAVAYLGDAAAALEKRKFDDANLLLGTAQAQVKLCQKGCQAVPPQWELIERNRKVERLCNVATAVTRMLQRH
ncbi:unnamed protein product [Alopecurus aequalis]